MPGTVKEIVIDSAFPVSSAGPELKSVEEWAAECQTSLNRYRALRRLFRWAIGKLLTRADYLDALSRLDNHSVKG